MQHLFKLQPIPFNKIKSGAKKIESRLYDEKRQNIQIGDIIVFQKQPDLTETIIAKVIGLLQYMTFTELMHDLPAKYFGWHKTQEATDEIYQFYSKEQERAHSVLGIKIALL